MGIEKIYKVIDTDENLIELPNGTYFCNDCLKKRKIITDELSNTIEPCPSCGSKFVFTT